MTATKTEGKKERRNDLSVKDPGHNTYAFFFIKAVLQIIFALRNRHPLFFVI